MTGELKNATDVDALDVTSLRERLLEANLEIDGNREILVERLKTRSRQKDINAVKAVSIESV